MHCRSMTKRSQWQSMLKTVCVVTLFYLVIITQKLNINVKLGYIDMYIKIAIENNYTSLTLITLVVSSSAFVCDVSRCSVLLN